MINKDSKSYGIIATTLITIGVILIIGLSFKNLDVEYEEATSYIPAEKQVLAVGTPKYVNYEDIKSDDEYISKDDKSKYSQINIKNTSNHTLYNIEIDLAQQEMNEKSAFLLPTYTITSLKPGESAVLSYQHNDLKENQPLTIDSYTYMDGNGKTFEINNTKSSDENNPNTYIETNKKAFKYEKLTVDINKITIENTKTDQSNGKKYLTIDLKNNSEVELKNVNLIFKEYDKDIVVGEKILKEFLNLKPKEKATISIEVNSDIKLELEKYVYSINDASTKDKYNKVYTVFINEDKYHLEEYVDSEVQNRRNMIFLIANFLVLGICKLLDIYCNKLEKKSDLEENVDYHKKAKIIKIINNVIYIVYVVVLIYFLLYRKI